MFKSRRYRGGSDRWANEVKYLRRREWDGEMGRTSAAGRAQLWQLRGNYELKGGHPGRWNQRLSQNLYEIRFSISLPGQRDGRSLLSFSFSLFLFHCAIPNCGENRNAAATSRKRMQSFRRITDEKGTRKKSRSASSATAVLFTFSYGGRELKSWN